MGVTAFAIPSIGVLASFLRADLEISRSHLGWVVSSIALVTAATSPFSGRWADALGGRRMFLGMLVTNAVVAAALASSTSFLMLALLAPLAGLPNGANNPATNALIVNHVPKGRRGVVMGIKQSGVQAGIFLVSVTLPPVAVVFGWRGAISTVTVASLAVATVGWLRLPPGQTRTSPLARGFAAAHSGDLRWLAGYALLMGSGASTITAFLPLYAHESLGFSPELAGIAASGIGLVGVLARIALGHTIERLGHFAMPLAALGAGAALATLAFVSARMWPGWLWVGVALAGVTVASWNTVAMLAAVSASSQDEAGQATGLVVMGFMGGFVVAPIIFGALADRTAGYTASWSAAIGVFSAAAGLSLAWWWSRRAAET